MYLGLQVEYPLFMSDFNQTCCLERLPKNPQLSNFMKLCPVGAELLHMDGQTDRQTHRQRYMIKLVTAFHNIVNVAKK
jgi:hypothetical protein